MKLQKLSPKQRDFLLHSDARINIACGAVRSGKTLVSILRWLYIVATCPEGSGLLMCAKTERTLRRNILDLIAEIVGPDDFDLRSGVGECYIFGKKIYLVGANDERSENKIRGITLYAAYLDEVSLYPESFFQMLLSRLSVQGAILIATTNPDSPYHYIKTKFIDREKDLNLKYWHFILDDNLTLSEDFKTDIKREYVLGTVWHKRMVLGQWAAAEGAVFPFLTDDPKDGYVLSDLPNDLTTWLVAADYGQQHWTVFILAGYSPSLNRWIVVKEWFTKDKTNAVYSEEFNREILQFNGGVPIQEVNVDPGGGGLSLVRQFESDFPNISVASAHKKDVDKELQELATALFTKKIGIYAGCQHGLEQLLNYTWDDKAKSRGKDEPLKVNDDFPDALRYLWQMCLRYS